MKNVSILFIFIFVVFSCATVGQQSYASHRVQEGETVSGIANKYNITVYELYRLNPEARGNLYPGLVLILPGNKSIDTRDYESDNGDFKTYTVKRKETLFGISQAFDVPVDVIKKYNKRLYSEELKAGDKIQIPINYTDSEENQVTEKPSETNRKHIVKPKETKYGLAAMYGITIAELEALNPEIVDGLKVGTILNVPDKSYTENAVIEDSEYGFYEVQPQETFYSLTRRWDMSKEELIKLNPALADGLKKGMILKLPKSITGIEASTSAIGQVDLTQRLNNFSTKNIALMLPFNLGKTVVDTGDVRKKAMKDDRIMRIALDFYSGAIMAIDSAKTLGISTNLNVYDTQYTRREEAGNARKIEDIINRNDFNNVDAVIGPLLSANVEKASSVLRNRQIPVVSPITPRLNLASNLFQSRPSEDLLRQHMMDYISLAGEGKNIIIIADGKHTVVKNKILARYPNAKVVNPRKGDNGYFLYGNDITAKISETQENWIILETNDIPLISNVTTDLSTKVADRRITLLTTNKGTAYNSDDISNVTLMNLNFHFPSVDREYEPGDAGDFIAAYKNKYGVVPNSYAVRGFDVTFDTLLRLASSEDLYDSATNGFETHYVENKFNYIKDSRTGYFNDAVYILKYGPELMLEEVEVPTDVVERLNTIQD